LGNKAVTYSILGIIILFFLTYFLIQNTIFSSGDLIENELNNIVRYANANDWTKAEESSNNLENIWNKQKYLLALNYAEADYSFFLDNLARIQGAIKTKDDTESVSQALSSLKLWNNFEKVIPEP
jgi:hypothetical protein